MKNIYISYALRFIIGLTFIVSAFLKMYPIAPFEILFIKLSIANWYWAPIIARLIISFEFALGTLIITNLYLKKTLFVSLITLIGFTLFLVYFKFYLGKNDNCGCFGSIIQLNPIESIIKNIGLIIGILFLLHKFQFNELFQWKYKKYAFLFLVIGSVLLPFAINPLNTIGSEQNYIIKPGKFITKTSLTSISFQGKNVNLLKGKKIICFLSLTCKACKFTASKFAILNKNHNNTLPIYIIFLDHSNKKELIPSFFKETDAQNIPYTVFPAQKFYSLSDISTPFIMYLNNGEIINLSNYNDMYPEKVMEFLQE